MLAANVVLAAIVVVNGPAGPATVGKPKIAHRLPPGQPDQGVVLAMQPTSTEAAAPQSPSAGQLLAQARRARSIWTNFPGFNARLRVATTAGYVGQGTLTVTAGGEVKLTGFPSGLDEKQVGDYLESLVGHRLAETNPDERVEFADDGTPAHPLGRLVKFVGDEKLHSSYRLRDDVVTQVNREMGEVRFSIDVLHVHRDATGKYVPEVFTVTFRDKSSGALKRCETHLNEWTQVGNFELPSHIRLQRSGADAESLLTLDLAGHELLPAEQSGSKP
jgi:hypothetical protein